MDIVNFLDKLNWQTIISMFAISWYFTHEVKNELKEQGKRIDRLYEMFVDLLKEKNRNI